MLLGGWLYHQTNKPKYDPYKQSLVVSFKGIPGFILSFPTEHQQDWYLNVPKCIAKGRTCERQGYSHAVTSPTLVWSNPALATKPGAETNFFGIAGHTTEAGAGFGTTTATLARKMV